MFIRLLHAVLLKQLNESNKIVMLYGPRQTGKTTLLKLLVEKFKGAVSWANGDLKNIQEAFSSQNLERLKEMVDDADLLIIDEAQNLTPHEVKTIITRAGENTKIVFTGDIYQIDTPYLDAESNGLSYIIDRVKNNNLFAHVTLVRGERSELANLANELL